MQDVARADLPPRFTWSKMSYTLICPNGHIIDLEDLDIGNSGLIRGIVECPKEGCDFKDEVRLLDWEGGQ